MASLLAPSVDESVAELVLATLQLQRRLRNVSNPDELSWSQIAALARLEEIGAATTADLARVEGVKPQSMGALLATMEAEGLIERRPHPVDGRQVLFALTEEGMKTRKSYTLLKREWLANAIARLDPSDQQILAEAAALIRRIANY